jgi:itaconyl-CoA hydratase
VLAVAPAEREDAGIVHFRHWGVNQDEKIVFEGERRTLIKRRSHWASK